MTIITVGVHLINDEEVNFIATSHRRAFKMENYDELQNSIKNITESACPTEGEKSTNIFTCMTKLCNGLNLPFS